MRAGFGLSDVSGIAEATSGAARKACRIDDNAKRQSAARVVLAQAAQRDFDRVNDLLQSPPVRPSITFKIRDSVRKRKEHTTYFRRFSMVKQPITYLLHFDTINTSINDPDDFDLCLSIQASISRGPDGGGANVPTVAPATTKKTKRTAKSAALEKASANVLS